MSSTIQTFARQSLAAFCVIYREITAAEQFISADELEVRMWSKLCANDAGVVKQSFKIPIENVKKSKVQLPYLPDDIKYSGCCALKKNGGLFTPCCGKIKTEDDEEAGFLCVTCGKADLKFGTINDRQYNIDNETIKPISYGEWMVAHKTNLLEVYEKLAEHGISILIPDEQQVVRNTPKKARRGRPGKSDDSVVDEDSVPKKSKKAKAESDSEEPKKSKKSKKEKAESDSEEPKKSKKEKKAKAESDEPKKSKKAKAESDSEEEPKKSKKSKKSKSDESKTEGSDSDESEAKRIRKAAKKAAKAKEEQDVSNLTEGLGELTLELSENEDQIAEICGKDYTIRDTKAGKIVISSDGEIVGKITEDGECEWVEGYDPTA